LFDLLGFYYAPSASCVSVFSFCLIYYAWGLLFAGCNVVVPLICESISRGSGQTEHNKNPKDQTNEEENG